MSLLAPPWKGSQELVWNMRTHSAQMACAQRQATSPPSVSSCSICSEAPVVVGTA